MSRRSCSRSGPNPQSPSPRTSFFASRPSNRVYVPSACARASSSSNRGIRRYVARYPVRHACWARAHATYDFPVPVAPVMITFACDPIHAHVASWRSRGRSSSRFGVKSMSSMQALWIRSFASRRARATRLLSRARCSASTSIPKRPSKSISFIFGSSRCAVHAAAIAPSRRPWSLSIVGSVSIVLLPFVSVVVVAATHVLVRERERGRRVGRNDAIETVLEDRLDVPIRARPHPDGAKARGLEARFAVALAESENAEARAEALLGVGTVSEDRFAQLA